MAGTSPAMTESVHDQIKVGIKIRVSVIASEAKQSSGGVPRRWIASSLALLAMTDRTSLPPTAVCSICRRRSPERLRHRLVRPSHLANP